ncbi:MAG TPA: hypothetical protein PK743_09515 [Luteimonas sp.]|nr:hypothetical protein [Luteimonas sp.]HRP72858.1 hypothetical protein [Luteimonas sp.]
MSRCSGHCRAVLFIALSSCIFLPAFAQQHVSKTAPGAAPKAAEVSKAGALSPEQRGELARQFVGKWGNYVTRVYDVPADTWAMRMVPNFVSADPANLRNSLKRDTFEGAVSELGGVGHRVADSAVIDQMARASLKGAPDAAIAAAAGKALGALGNDLVYTPVQPCRIIDTRSTAAGPIAANGTRSFLAINSSNFTAQGGSSTNCGTSGLNATAVAINLTAVAPAIAGYATAYPYGTTQPLAASVNYAAGAIVNNALIVQIPNPLASYDFTLYTFAQSHYVADIVGYFAPPVATALQCVETANGVGSVAAGSTRNQVAPSCPTGYTQTATNCESSEWLMPIVWIKNGLCSARNNSASAAELRASRTCCRVPGR